MNWFHKLLLFFLSLGFLGAIAGIAGFSYVIAYYGRDLPDYNQLQDYEPPIVTRLYAGDGGLLAEYAQEKRIFIPIEIMPDLVKHAFLSAEDKNFYEHQGVDTFAIARAMVTNLKQSGSGKRLIGASTITQQVAKNFLLTNEVSYARKIKEAILAIRIEKALSKDQLLELYLNEIYLGQRAYGVAAAALTYFNKSLEELSIAEIAYLAALPKAPNNYHPVRHHDRAVDRRNWVIGRMKEDGYIDKEQTKIALAEPLKMIKRIDEEKIDADFFAEEVRRELQKKYGDDSLYKGGLAVRSSVDPDLQKIAMKALRDGLSAYDKRHGWRGPVANLKTMDDWAVKLNNIATPEGKLDNWKMAVVLSVTNQSAQLAFKDKAKAPLNLKGVRWARKCLQDCYALGPEIIKVSQVVETGDVIMVEEVEKEWILRQAPKVQGAIIALDPHTGRVLAMQGGWTFSASKFNRATQAKRQPGSAFKPFVYLAALDEGFTPATRVLDAPFVIEQAPGDFWRPTNYSNKFYGPTPLRMGIEKSRNLMTVRLADEVGMEKVVDYATRFGIADEMKPFLSYALGAGETTLLRLTTAYGMLVNGGKKITPTFIDRIQDRHGETVFSYDKRPCANCGDLIRWDGQKTPVITDTREQISDEKTTYQIVSILEGVAKRGTARKLVALERPLAGKTGTTNESKDTWFIGFSPNLVVGVFVGFDDPKSMGKRETGSSVALPIFKDFMEEALKDTPAVPFRVPAGLKNVRVNSKTGRLARPGDENVIWEAFVAGTEPNIDDYVLDTGIIGEDNTADPYGDNPYGQFGYEENAGNSIYNDGSVEVYDPTAPSYQNNNEDGSFSYFSNRQRQQEQNNTTKLPNSERVIINPNPPIEEAVPATPSPDFTGTGGIY